MTSERRTIPLSLDQLLSLELRAADRDSVFAETLREIAAVELPVDEAEAIRASILGEARGETSQRTQVDVREPVPLERIVEEQRKWSLVTFGTGTRRLGLLEHIRKELHEVAGASDENVLGEWVDVVILALDGAWRTGASPEQVVEAILWKQAINAARSWPDPSGFSEDEPIEHERG